MQDSLFERGKYVKSFTRQVSGHANNSLRVISYTNKGNSRKPDDWAWRDDHIQFIIGRSKRPSAPIKLCTYNYGWSFRNKNIDPLVYYRGCRGWLSLAHPQHDRSVACKVTSSGRLAGERQNVWRANTCYKSKNWYIKDGNYTSSYKPILIQVLLTRLCALSLESSSV